jgi:hypothetical protein
MDLVEEFNSHKQQCQNMARVARDPDTQGHVDQYGRAVGTYRRALPAGDDTQEAAPHFAPA